MTDRTTCGTCAFWDIDPRQRTWRKPGEAWYGNGGPNWDGSAAQCRRYAPRERHPDKDRSLYGGDIWPVTRARDWCGEYIARPEPAQAEDVAA